MNATTKGPELARKHFETSRQLDYLSAKELTTQTGHRPAEWPLVILKELADNALDACEEAGIAPEITVNVSPTGIEIIDNGPGLPSDVVDKILDFNIRVSSREAYVSPDRGAQGNALKTLVAMPFVLFGGGQVVIEAKGTRHQISIAVDQVQQVPKIDHQKTTIADNGGTRFVIDFESDEARFNETDDDQFLQNRYEFDDDELEETPDLTADEASLILPKSKARFLQLAEAYTWFNPHLSLKVTWGDDTLIDLVRGVEGWKKWLASNATDPHWYNLDNLKRLIAAHIGFGTKHVRELVTEFKGLTSTVKSKRVLESAGLSRAPLADLAMEGDFDHDKVGALLEAMKAETRPVKPKAIGIIGEDHFRQRCLAAGCDENSFKYRKVLDVTEEGIPFVLETVFAFCPERHDRLMVTGVNWSPGIQNPFRQLGDFGRSLDSVLGTQYAGDDEPIIFVLHVACPKVAYADRGKSTVIVEG